LSATEPEHFVFYSDLKNIIRRRRIYGTRRPNKTAGQNKNQPQPHFGVVDQSWKLIIKITFYKFSLGDLQMKYLALVTQLWDPNLLKQVVDFS
jgi:hypothetical protein